MSERLDEIRAWVSVDPSITEPLVTALEDPQAAEVALDAIRKARAQIVVDTVAQELVNRQTPLLDTKASLELQLADIDRDLNIIDSRFNPEKKPDIVDPKNYIMVLSRHQNSETFLDDVARFEPFIVDIPEDEREQSWRRSTNMKIYSLKSWQFDREKEIRSRYGTGARGRFSRLAEVFFSEGYKTEGHLQNLADEGVVSKVETIEDSSGSSLIRLTVDQPAKFASKLLTLDGIGLVTAAAIFCIADMQALERSEQKEQLEQSVVD
jgi:hypothetical protein